MAQVECVRISWLFDAALDAIRSVLSLLCREDGTGRLCAVSALMAAVRHVLFSHHCSRTWWQFQATLLSFLVRHLDTQLATAPAARAQM